MSLHLADAGSDPQLPTLKTRRGVLTVAAGAVSYAMASPAGAGQPRPDLPRNTHSVPTRKDNPAMRGFISDHPRARQLIRVGNEAIVKRNDPMLRAYFTHDYVFHGPAGDRSFDQLSSYFASLRAAFTDLRLVREQILVEGAYLAARNTFSGVFTRVFTQSPIGAVQPTGKYTEWEAINTFRYDADERLAEEWVQTDYRSLLVKLGVDQG